MNQRLNADRYRCCADSREQLYSSSAYLIFCLEKWQGLHSIFIGYIELSQCKVLACQTIDSSRHYARSVFTTSIYFDLDSNPVDHDDTSSD